MTHTLYLSYTSSISGPNHLSVNLTEDSLKLRSTDPSDVLPGILCEKGEKNFFSIPIMYFSFKDIIISKYEI